MIGDSITHSIDQNDRKELREKFLDQYKTLNLGISGDRTENVIWRLQNGALDGIAPKVATLLIGTNNTDGNHYLCTTIEHIKDLIIKSIDLLS